MENHVQLEENLEFLREQTVTLVPDSSSTETVNSELASLELKRYSYDDLVTMTSNFANQIASGSAANVYKGQLPNGVQVVVRVLRDATISHFFFTEVSKIQTIYHQNLVRLYGYCNETNKKSLVYEYMDNVSLDLILYKNPLGIEWDKFYGIAIEMAKALAYLHCRQIVHHNFRAAHVLLDSKLCPKLTHFGLENYSNYVQSYLVKFIPREALVYAAPEVRSQESFPTSKSDVYSFGILLFEILKRQQIGYEHNWFPKRVWCYFKDKKLNEALAVCRIKEKDKKKATILTMVAMWCIQCTPSARPSMSTVAVVLETEVSVSEPRNPFLATSRPLEMQPKINFPKLSPFTRSEVSNPILKMQPQVNYSEVSSLTRSKVSVSTLKMPAQVNQSEVSFFTCSEVSDPTLKVQQPQVNHSEVLSLTHSKVSSLTRSEVSDPTFKISPQATRSEVSDLTLKMQPLVNHSEVLSFTHSEVSSFSLDVLPELESPGEQQKQEGGNARSSSTKILMHELSLQEQTRYSYDELKKISANFNDRIGGGAYGDVFKGQLSNGVDVAIKVLKTNNIIEQTFLAEVRTMGSTKHQSLIKLIGFCSEGTHMALVYDYMEMGSLDTVLYHKPLSIEWKKLYGIAVDIARALAHLHHDCEPQIIHFDVKPANVLLGVDHSPKLTDFGLATLNDKGASHVTMTNAKGTVGFGAPEVWVPFAHVTSKCDVYSFGMVLLEILGMARNNAATEWFPKYVWEMLDKGKLNDVIMEYGIKEKDRKKATVLAMVALWCIQYTPETRPTMITVVKVLEKQIPVKKPPDPFQTSHWVTSMHSELNFTDDIPLNLKSSRARIKSMIGLFE